MSYLSSGGDKEDYIKYELIGGRSPAHINICNVSLLLVTVPICPKYQNIPFLVVVLCSLLLLLGGKWVW